MTANDYSIEKYVFEYLKPLEEKGIITDLRVIPCRWRIMFRLNEPSRENSMKVIIETEADEDHITFFKSDVSVEETFRSPERRFIYQRLMAANKSINDELNRKSVNTDLYITKYLKPLEEKGLIKDLATCKNHSVWFTMVKDIKGVSITVNLIPGTTVDTVVFFPLPIDINGNGVVTTFIPNPINDDHYTENLEKRIQELEGLTTQHALSDVEFDLMRQLLTVFKDGIDEMTIEQKRAAIRTIVRKVIWDGVNAHVVLFGVQDDEIEYPEIASAASDNTDDEDDNDELVAFSDVDYEDDDTEDDRLGKTNPLSASKTHWGEDSK